MSTVPPESPEGLGTGLPPKPLQAGGKVEAMIPVPITPSGNGDLSGGTLKEADKANAEKIKADAHDRRVMRRYAFAGLGVGCLFFLCQLLIELRSLLDAFKLQFSHFVPERIPLTPDTHIAILVGLIIVVSAAVPLSLAITIVRLAEEPRERPKDEETLSVTTPHLEVLKQIAALIKSIKGGSE